MTTLHTRGFFRPSLAPVSCCLLVAISWASNALGAGELPANLTPIGAERGASADGRIPAWQGGLTAAQQRLASNGTPLDPYAGERPLYEISAQNYQQYEDQLSAGQIAELAHLFAPAPAAAPPAGTPPPVAPMAPPPVN